MTPIPSSFPSSLPELSSALGSLKNPGQDFRALPFWSWNARLSPAELRRQIRLFRDMGFGGFFMHSREGLATKYLGSEWFDCVRACADEAKALGMRAWAYDEDRWPSGAAGGLVTTDRRHANRALVREPVDAVPAPDGSAPDCVWFAEKIEETADTPRVASYRRLHDPAEPLRRGESRVRYRVKVADGQPRFNGGSYLDVLGREAVRAFIHATHDAYARELGADCNAAAAVPGFFTDEPQLQDPVPWTDAIPRAFRRRFGYELLDRLPELFAVVGGDPWSAVRYDYREIVAELFASSFSAQIARWCARHGVLSTGHAMAEDTPLSQMDRMSSAMRFYEPMQLPGIDLLTEHWLPILTAKQCVSVARQTGRPLRLCECYGCTGWDFPLEGHVAIGDWLLALGVNMRVPHLAWYSMAGRVKRDYPASISRQSPWFRHYAAVENRAARAASLAGRGREERDLLVLHPAESHWGARVGWGTDAAHYNDHQRKGRASAKPGFTGQAALAARDDAFVALVSDIASRHIDFDLGDEAIMARRGRIATGALWVGKAKYRAVLLPAQLQTIRATTLALLERFANAGGAVFAQGEAPSRVDGRQSAAAARAWRHFRHVPQGIDALDAAISPAARRLSLAQDGSECSAALVHERSWRDGSVYFVHNVSTEPPRSTAESIGGAPRVAERNIAYPKAVLSVPAPRGGAADVREIDLETGISRPAAFAREGSTLRIECPLARLQSRLFAVRRASDANDAASDKISKGGDSTPRPSEGRTPQPRVVAIPRGRMDFSLDEPNALVLDWAQWSLVQPDGAGNGKSPKIPSSAEFKNILAIDREARMALGVPCRGDKPYQPWAIEAGMGPSVPSTKATLSLRFVFQVRGGASAVPCELAMERPDLWRISLNGAPLAVPKRTAWWIDPCLRRIPLPSGMLREGRNVLEMRCDSFCASHPGLEAAFILGAFAVTGGDRADAGTIRPLASSLRPGDVAGQGLPNYGGNIAYRFRADVPARGPVRLAPSRWAGTAIGFRVNGGPEIFRPTPPYEAVFDGDSLRRDGSDEFEVILYGSRRNQLGPFYIAGGVRWPLWTGNAEMDSFAAAPRRELVQFGLGAGGNGDGRRE